MQVINFSKENRRFALDLAAVAQVSIDYVVYDIMEAASLDLPHKFDVPVFELASSITTKTSIIFFSPGSSSGG